jgi:hypothetical protein
MVTGDVLRTDRDKILNQLCEDVKSLTEKDRDDIARKILSGNLPDKIKCFVLILIDRPLPSLSSPSDHSTTEPVQTQAA